MSHNLIRRRFFVLLVLFSSHALAANDIDGLLQQGYQQTKAGDLDAALHTLETAVEQDPSSSLAFTRLGGIRVLRQEYGGGVEAFQQAIMLDQTNASAFIGMAVAYLHMGQSSLARAALTEAGRLDPAKKAEIDKILARIDQRSRVSATGH